MIFWCSCWRVRLHLSWLSELTFIPCSPFSEDRGPGVVWQVLVEAHYFVAQRNVVLLNTRLVHLPLVELGVQPSHDVLTGREVLIFHVQSALVLHVLLLCLLGSKLFSVLSLAIHVFRTLVCEILGVLGLPYSCDPWRSWWAVRGRVNILQLSEVRARVRIQGRSLTSRRVELLVVNLSHQAMLFLLHELGLLLHQQLLGIALLHVLLQWESPLLLLLFLIELPVLLQAGQVLLEPVGINCPLGFQFGLVHDCRLLKTTEIKHKSD